MARKRSIYTNEYNLHNKVTLIRGGSDYFDRIEQLIDLARHTIHLQTYIFDEDETGRRVADALIRAAARKVAVYLLVDGYASKNLTATFIKTLTDAGVHFAFFRQFFKSDVFYFGRRLHHKILVADAVVCITAGLNISNRYNDIGTTRAWLDWAILTEGKTAAQVHDVCVMIWNRSAFREKSKYAGLPDTAFNHLPECKVRIRRNDWVYSKTEITRSYRKLFAGAHNYVTVMTGYFWPPYRLLHLMARASARGVKISVILTATADVPFSKYTERYFYNFLFRHNINIYEYNKNILHGKLAVCDDVFVSSGSYNMNNISAFASVELNLEIRNEAIATALNSNLQQIITDDCTEIIREQFFLTNNPLRRFFYFLSYYAIHFVFFLFTFYFRQRRAREY